MGYDAMANDASVPAISRDIVKKKRTNRSAKLKQCKLDARREQWLSQVKNKGCKATAMGISPTLPPPHPSLSLPRARLGNPEARSVEDERRAAIGRDGLGAHESDAESPVHSPTPSTTGKVPRKRCPNNRISRGSSIGSCSGSVSDPEEEDGEEEIVGEKGGLDDWEAVADALCADNSHGRRLNPDPVVIAVDSSVTRGFRNEARGGSTAKPESTRTIPRAWRPDDVFRPQSLPNLSKQRSFPGNMERHYRVAGWAHHGILSTPTSCPICYEDLDLTDSSFLPCSCGFRLCLFCHKRIIEADGRCPGCRKQYTPMVGAEMGVSGGVPLLPYRLSRSCSMNSRS